MKKWWVVCLFAVVSCGSDTSPKSDGPVVVEAVCGNGIVESDEVCDGDQIGDASCPAGGSVVCSSDCRSTDLSGCDAPETCGNGGIDEGEVCDAENVETTCEEEGFGEGAISCAANCLSVDTSACGAAASCGNGVLDDGEVCDGSELGAGTCDALGFPGGDLGCSANCREYNTDACDPIDTCGDGTIQDAEACDGDELNGQTCTSVGAGIGTLACGNSCEFDTSQCAPPSGFSGQAQQWETPDHGSGAGFYNTFRGNGSRHWSTIDMDGDGALDLVVTGDPNFDFQSFGSVGNWSWRVYRNNGSGFEKTPMTWSTPDHGSGVGFYNTVRGNGARHWSTIDMNGDSRPDLVVTGDPNFDFQSFGSVGNWSWRVYLNNGSGFDDTPITWSTPDHGSGVGFYNTDRGNGARHWSTFDIDGDELPDLIVTGDPDFDFQSFGSVGNWSWRVYKNNGAGFDATPITWSTPDHGSGAGFYNTARGNGARHWSTTDLDGDDLPDLVVTGDPNFDFQSFGAIGNWSWRVYKNNGSGFDPTPVTWSTPDHGSGAGFYNTFRGNGARHWGIIDMNGDGLLDLTVTGDPNFDFQAFGAVGNWSWKVYLNEGDGFSGTDIEWSVPDHGSGAGYYNLFRGNGARHWSTLDLDGDGLVELVTTGDPNFDFQSFGSVGSWYWNVHKIGP